MPRPPPTSAPASPASSKARQTTCRTPPPPTNNTASRKPVVAALIQQTGRALAHDNPAPCLSHGDLSLDQIIHSPDGTYHLIDWDNACRATPDADLATLIGKTLAHTPTTDAHTLRDALIDGYARPINRHSLHWRTIAALIRLIPEPYRRRDPAWPDTMRARLEQTAQIAAQP